MKNILIVIITFFIGITYTFAKTETVINELSILNGELSPKFDKYNNYYSVTINKDINELDFNYTIDNDEKYSVEIINNNNLVQNKYVYATIYDKETDEKNTYIFKVFMNDGSDVPVFNEIKNEEKSDVKVKKRNYAPLIGTICFLLIIFVFKTMFL